VTHGGITNNDTPPKIAITAVSRYESSPAQSGAANINSLESHSKRTQAQKHSLSGVLLSQVACREPYKSEGQ